MPKISLKPVGQQIRSIQKQLRSSRGGVLPEQRSEVDALIAKLDTLHEQTYDCCPKAMDGLPVKAARAAAKSKAKSKAKRSATKRRTR